MASVNFSMGLFVAKGVAFDVSICLSLLIVFVGAVGSSDWIGANAIDLIDPGEDDGL